MGGKFIVIDKEGEERLESKETKSEDESEE